MNDNKTETRSAFSINDLNRVVKQWIVKRKYLLGDYSYRLLVLLENGDYYFSNGEVGDFLKLSKEEAEKMINREL